MKDFKEILVENLIALRKSNKLTQLELSEKIGYSDKAISRWEHGEVLPDVLTLKNLADIYGVPFASLFEENLNVKKEQAKANQSGNKLIIAMLSIVSVWALMVLLFIAIKLRADIVAWQLFVLGVPLSFLLAIIFNGVWGKKKHAFIFASLFMWSLFAYIYLQLLSLNLWMIFILAVPIQVLLILSYKIKRSKK
jgi:transcriptional regulator with XRE-family HTH domain